MKIKKIDINNNQKGEVSLPGQFSEAVREDLIKRAVHALQSNRRQKYGAKIGAGLRASAELSRRRRKYRGSYGHGISRVPRKILTRRGTRFHWVGAVAPGTVKGRRAHPPKAEKEWDIKINKKEKRKAIRSAISATVIKEVVSKRGHKIPENYPFVVSKGIENISKTKEITSVLTKLGFQKDLNRASIRKIRAGKGKARGRKYKKKKSLLIVVGDKCNLKNSAANIPGVEVASVKELNVEMLAPGAAPGRATIWSENAIEALNKNKLFM